MRSTNFKFNQESLTGRVDADFALQVLGVVGGRRVGGERLVGDVPAAVGVGHRLHQQVARVQSGDVVVRVALVEVHDVMPLVPGMQSEGEDEQADIRKNRAVTDQRACTMSSFQFP